MCVHGSKNNLRVVHFDCVCVVDVRSNGKMYLLNQPLDSCAVRGCTCSTFGLDDVGSKLFQFLSEAHLSQ
jgi:hypothetical protein